MRAAQPSSTAGGSFPCHRAFLTCDHEQREECTSTSTPPLVHTNIITHLLPHSCVIPAVCPCVSPLYCVCQPVLNTPFCSPLCFPSCQGVIRPGDTQQVEFKFKSEEPGIKTELWQLITHPVLLQGASMQVTLSGVALYQDKTADQRLSIEVIYNNTVSGSKTEKWSHGINRNLFVCVFCCLVCSSRRSWKRE